MTRMTRRFMCLTIAVAFFAAGSSTFAHHGQAAYDSTVPVTVTGTLTEFQFVNPHCIVYLEVKDAKGAAEKWQGELTSPNRLVRAGWNAHSLKPGDQVGLTGWRAKNGSNSLWITKTMVNGKELKTAMDAT
jgi:hypothetical protein